MSFERLLRVGLIAVSALVDAGACLCVLLVAHPNMACVLG
jgi:hypothetical protein